MHECPFCGQACDCDMDDTWGLPVPDDCPHECPDDDFEGGFETDQFSEFSNARLNELSKFVSQLEARADLHANLNRGVAKALGLEPNADWSELPNQVGDLKERFEACESALLSMVYQYLYRPLDPRTNEPADNLYQHDFMSAGEEACYYLVTNGLAEWVDDDSWAIRMKESEEE